MDDRGWCGEDTHFIARVCMKRLRVIAVVVAVLFLGWLVIYIATPIEPSYQCRTLTQWIKDYVELEGRDKGFPKTAAKNEKARNALKQIGTNALPNLLQWIQAKDAPIKTKLISLLERQSYVHLRIMRAKDRQDIGFNGFKLLGKDARPAIASLVQLTKSTNQEVRQISLVCLWHTDPDKRTLLHVLSRFVRDPDTNMQELGNVFLHYQYFYYREEMEKAGAYEMFPELKHSASITVETNLPVAK
jgi:hypothetical protein